MQWSGMRKTRAKRSSSVCVCVCVVFRGEGVGEKKARKKKKKEKEREEYNKSGETMSELHVVHLGSQPTEIAGQGPGLLG